MSETTTFRFQIEGHWACLMRPWYIVTFSLLTHISHSTALVTLSTFLPVCAHHTSVALPPLPEKHTTGVGVSYQHLSGDTMKSHTHTHTHRVTHKHIFQAIKGSLNMSNYSTINRHTPLLSWQPDTEQRFTIFSGVRRGWCFASCQFVWHFSLLNNWLSGEDTIN